MLRTLLNRREWPVADMARKAIQTQEPGRVGLQTRARFELPAYRVPVYAL